MPFGMGPYGYYYGFAPYWGWGWGRGWGRGNPYPFCRFFPWLPRWWWATGSAGLYPGTIPFPQINVEQEKEFLRQQEQFLENQLSQIKVQIAELEKKGYGGKDGT